MKKVIKEEANINMKKVLNIKNKIFVAIFYMLIFFPIFLTMLHIITGKSFDRKLKGYFDPIEKPELTISSVKDGSFQDSFANYFHNTFTGRGIIITSYNQIRHSLFGENSSQVIGDGYIHEPYIKAYLGIGDFDYSHKSKQNKMIEYVNKLQAISDYLESKGKNLIVVSACNKAENMQKYIPYKYYQMMPLRNYGPQQCFDALMNKSNMLYLNSQEYLNSIDFDYPIYYKSSHHWSRPAEVEIENKILDMINTNTSYHVETYNIIGVEKSDMPYERDADTLDLMNLWTRTDDIYYNYDISVNPVSDKVNICIQGDSYTTYLASDLVVNGHNGDVINLNYDAQYIKNNKLILSLDHDWSKIDFESLINDNDIFIICYMNSNLPGYGFGFVDNMYDYIRE